MRLSHPGIQARAYTKATKTPLADLCEALGKARVEGGVTGMSVAVLHEGELIFTEGFGKRNGQDPFTAEVL